MVTQIASAPEGWLALVEADASIHVLYLALYLFTSYPIVSAQNLRAWTDLLFWPNFASQAMTSGFENSAEERLQDKTGEILLQ